MILITNRWKNFSLFFLFSLSSLSAEEILSSDEQQYLKSKKEIKVCVDPHWMPFEQITDQGIHEGILSDYMKIFSKRLQTPFTLIKTVNYTESRVFLSKGKCDIITADQATEEIKKEYLTTKPYFTITRAFVTHTDAMLVHDFSQIAYSGRIGVIESTAAEIILPKEYPKIDMVAYKSSHEALRDVISKNIVAYVNTLPTLVYDIREDGFSNIKIAGTLPFSIKLSLLIHRENKALLPIFEKLLATITKEEKQTILNKWVQVKYENEIDYSLLIKIFLLGGLFLLLVLFLWYNTYKMNRELEKMHQKLKLQMEEEIQKNQEQQLFILQQNRLAQKGEMLSMIAHQWRQPLAVINGIVFNIDIDSRKNILSPERLDEHLLDIEKRTSYLSTTINDFMNFFKPARKEVDFVINESVHHAIDIVKPLLLQQGIEVIFEETEKYFHKGYPNKLGQVIVNIINNAKDALYEKESIDKKIVVKLYRDEKIYLKIFNNGELIPQEILEKIYDPYFSTKNDKEGTGLGLYMSKIIIEEHMNGHLNVKNIEDGVCFTITLDNVKTMATV